MTHSNRALVFPSILLAVVLLPLALWGQSDSQASNPLPTLTRAEQVRQLTADQAKQGYPVRIRGVITDDVPSPDFFIQDSTTGIFVEGSHSPIFDHKLGDEVEVEGVTGPGHFAPVIREMKLTVIGKGKLPKSQLYSFSELADGQQDSQWVRLRGFVRSVFIDRDSWHELTLAMNLASGGGQLQVRVPIPAERDFSSWLDNEVLIEGVCGSLFNSDRQFTGVLLYVPRLNFIKVATPAKEVPVDELLRFSPVQGIGQRVRVRGVVTYQQPGRRLFIQSQDKGLRLLTADETPFAIGDVVDVLGIPTVGESGPVLEDAVAHAVGHGQVPAPILLDVNNAWERYDGALVTVVAHLLQWERHGNQTSAVLQRDGNVFSATLQDDGVPSDLLKVPVNSEVRVTGICLVRSGGLWRTPESFRLLLRSPKDLAVLRAPSWWNPRHTIWVLAFTAAILLIVFAWIVVLGKRLREQMDLIRQKLRAGAVLEERNRIARELHDTIEQELVGITMQLDLATDCFQSAPDIARRATETARRMSRHSMVAARRSVWDLRCHLLEHGNLDSALREVVASVANGSGNQVEIDVNIKGEPNRLKPNVEMNLLRIGQEAITNALKHGNAKHVSVELEYSPTGVRLSVADDGKGFSAQEIALAQNSHFGLLDMRERAQSLGGSLVVESELGKGTRIKIDVEHKVYEQHKAYTYSGR
ncbi:MAG TPA: sensor histidine kinase [Terriglobales bacterium]|nr:sensor histidine kinase [Terriglobales bacterium]